MRRSWALENVSGLVGDGHQCRKERHDAGVADAKGRHAPAVAARGKHEVGELGSGEARLLGAVLERQQAGIDRVAPLAQGGEVVEALADADVARVAEGGLGAQGRPSLRYCFTCERS